MTGTLTKVELRFGRAGIAGRPFRIGFDLSYPTQGLIHSWLSNGHICDPPMVAVLTQGLMPGDTFIDIGSHVGYYSMLALQQVLNTGRVLAFEANPATYQVLLANVLMNDAANMHAFNCALGASSGTASFGVNAQDEGQSSLVDGAAANAGAVINVAMTTLDMIHAQIALTSVRVVKIDVEGFETQVIDGGRKFFADLRPQRVVFEVNNTDPGKPKYQDLGIRAYFRTLGYRAYLIRPWSDEDAARQGFQDRLLRPLGDEDIVDLPYGNILVSTEDGL